MTFPSHGPSQRFAGSPMARDAQLEPDRGELPQAYGTGRLFLVARDPCSLYAHWDLTQEQQKHYNDLSAHHHLLVRVHRDSLAGELVSEVHVHPESRHWFIHVAAAQGKYVVELGYYPPNGAWAMIAGSEPAGTLAAAAAGDQPVRFASLPAAPVSSGGQQPTAPAGTHKAEPEPEPALGELARSAYASQEPGPIPAQTTVGPMAFVPSFSETAADLPAGAGLSLEQNASTPTPVPTRAPEWTRAQERALAELIAHSFVRHGSISSAEIEELIRARLERAAVSSRGNESFAIDIPSPLAPEQAEISSAALGEAPVTGRPGFWFNVNAELVIYGATTSDAEVTLGGRPIRQRPDGTFSYRFALPDGAYRLPMAAASPHGDVRRAELEFYRGSNYSGDVGSHPQDPALGAPLVEKES